MVDHEKHDTPCAFLFHNTEGYRFVVTQGAANLQAMLSIDKAVNCGCQIYSYVRGRSQFTFTDRGG